MFPGRRATFSRVRRRCYYKVMSEGQSAQTEWGISLLALGTGFLIGVAAFLALGPRQAAHRAEAVFVRHPDYQACLNDPACRRKLRLPPRPRALPPPPRRLADPFWDRA